MSATAALRLPVEVASLPHSSYTSKAMSDPSRSAGARVPPPGKRIRTDQVRYPGLDPSVLPSDAPDPNAEGPSEPMRLGPVRDAGFTLGDAKRDRARSKRSRVRRQRTIAVAVVVAFLGIASVGAISMVSNAVRTGEKRAAVGSSVAVAEPGPARPIVSGTIAPQPTPTFATYKQLQLHLPVQTNALTELGFHQASFTYAFPMKTWLKDADLGKAGKKHGTGRDPRTAVGGDGRLKGLVLRLWRPNRPGRPDTAVDVGAPAGSPVVSPVSGVVLKVKAYKLYGQYDDYQVHIQPDGYPTVDVVLIHVDNVVAKEGDRVEAGVTTIAHVRRLSNRFPLELASYTPGPGDHTHLQLNNIKNPTYKGLKDE
jgi:murein DD-endopeptidase MepM/ murein hydrolase activator NlpD